MPGGIFTSLLISLAQMPRLKEGPLLDISCALLTSIAGWVMGSGVLQLLVFQHFHSESAAYLYICLNPLQNLSVFPAQLPEVPPLGNAHELADFVNNLTTDLLWNQLIEVLSGTFSRRIVGPLNWSYGGYE
jgi:hypothetical protein